MTGPNVQRLLARVGRRQFVARLADRWRVMWLVAAGIASALIVLARVVAVVPPQTVVPVLCALALLPFVVAPFATRRPHDREVARMIDERSGAKELFLTAALLDNTPGDFQPIVVEQAEDQARKVRPEVIVPPRWQRGARESLLALGVVAGAFWFLPQLDPFNREAARQKQSQQETRLAETKQATAIRREQLTNRGGEESEQVKQTLTQLEKTFKEARPLEREANLKKLGEHQKELGELWKAANQDQMRNSFDKAAQSFGQVDSRKLEQWREEFQRGEASSLKAELREIQEQVRSLAEQTDSPAKRAEQEKLAQKLNELTQGLKQLANSPEATAALERALEQLDLSQLGTRSNDAMQAALDSLNLSQEELERLTQSLKDAKQLAEALKNLQMAKQLADQQQLDGKECENCSGMGDYAALFASKMGPAGTQPGEGGSGMGPGIGNGAKRPEDESSKTAFQQEKSNSSLGGGKLLLEWKTKEVGQTGARTEQYHEAVAEVKQGVAEAIQQEQIPPGYHDAIKRYFDKLPTGP